jgi:transposase InsO family protein
MSKREPGYTILSYSEKCFIVKQLLENDLPLSTVSDQFHIGESTLRGWLKTIDYDIANIEQLKRPKPSYLDRKRPILTALPDWVQQEIRTLKKAHPSMGALKLKQYFYRHHQTILSEKKLYFFLKDHGILAKPATETQEQNRHDRRFEYPYPLAAVQIDLLTVQLQDNNKLYLVTLLDDYSRYILHSQFILNKTMDAVTGVLMQTVRIHGVMECIICDKGSEFVSWQGFTQFEQRLCELDIELIASGPDTPQNQGKLERWHQTYRQECERPTGCFQSQAQAQYETNRFVDYYNYERPHQAIGGLVPADRYYGLSDELNRALSQYHPDNHEQQCIYFSANINGKRIVVSGPRNGELRIYQNINPADPDKTE